MTKSDSRKALGKGLQSLLPGRASEPLAAEKPGERVLKIPVAQLHPNPDQPRADFDENALADLTHSIARHGILQPIIARKTAAGGYEIIAGERRWRAARQAGLAEVPVILRETGDNRTLELALIENIQREDLNPIELAHAFERMAGLGMSHEEIGLKTGKDRATITNALRLLQLPEEVQGLVATRRLSAGHARALLKIEGDEERKQLARRCIGEGWSVRQIEEYTRPKGPGLSAGERNNSRGGAMPEVSSRAVPADPNVRAAQQELQEVLGTKVRIITRAQGRGQIEIEYYSEEDLQRIFEVILAGQN